MLYFYVFLVKTTDLCLNYYLDYFPSSSASSQKYAARTNRGEVVCSLGAPPANWTRVGGVGSQVNVAPFDPKTHLDVAYKYMAQKTAYKAAGWLSALALVFLVCLWRLHCRF